MNKEQFLSRYKIFWSHFHPGFPIPSNLKTTALNYCEKLTKRNVSLEKFDEICSYLEDELGGDTKEGLSPNFNIVAYILDYIRSEYQQKMEAQESVRYINLPKQRTPLGQIDIEKLEPSLKILKRNCPNLDMLGILERINTLRAQGYGKEDRYCQSCDNTGWVHVSEREVACCQCKAGQRIYDNQGDKNRTRMAKYEECQGAARGVPF